MLIASTAGRKDINTITTDASLAEGCSVQNVLVSTSGVKEIKMPSFIDLNGQRFGKWKVLSRANSGKNGHIHWLCQCDCGRKRIVHGRNLRNGTSPGCQFCGRKERKPNFKHGLSRTKLYRVWKSMIERCEKLNSQAYGRYGRKGIKTCKEWRKNFKAFYNWAIANGYKEGLTIDRINNDKGYSPDNCQFITRSENTLKAWHVDGSFGKKYLTAS